MSLFGCSHAWEVKAKTFAPPVEPSFSSDVASKRNLAYLQQCLCGFTTVLMACTQCGKMDVTVMVGKEDGQP